MAIWLLNPPARRRKKARMVRSKRRPSRKQLAARKKFVAMVRARARAAKAGKRVPNPKRRSAVATRRRRRTRPAARRRRQNPMASVRRRGKAVSQKRWRASGYRRNPHRRRTRHRIVRRQNPMGLRGIGGDVFTLAKDAVAVMAGQALGRTVTNLIPFGGNTPVINAGKGLLVAIAIKKFGRKAVSGDLADMLAIGALIGPLKDLIVSVVPQAGSFLSGGYAMPRMIGSYASYAPYQTVRGGAADGVDTYVQGGENLGAYAYAEPWQT
jgi:hypothetical protein